MRSSGKIFPLFLYNTESSTWCFVTTWEGGLESWKTQPWPQDWKRSVFIQIPKKVNAKECSNYCTIALISHTNKIMLKILQARLQQYMNCELPDVQSGFRKGRGTRDQIVNIHWIMEKATEFQKNIYFSFPLWFSNLTDRPSSQRTVPAWVQRDSWPRSYWGVSLVQRSPTSLM